MNNKKIYLKAFANVGIYLVSAVLCIILVPKLLAFFLPFVIGWIISSIANPIVKFIERKIHFKRKTTSAIAIIFILAVVISITYGIMYVLITQGIGLVSSLSEKWDVIEEDFNQIGMTVNSWTRNLPEGIRDSLNFFGNNIEQYTANFVSNLSTPTLTAVSNVAKGLPSVIIAVIMGLLSAYFFTTERNNLSDKFEKFLPKVAYSKFQVVFRGMKNAVGGYFVAQFKIEIWVYLLTFIGLMILNVDYAAIIALGIAFMDFLPFFGAGIIMVPWATVNLFNHNYYLGIGMLIVWGLGQLIRQLIQPKVLGDQIGLNPLPTLFLLFIGFEIGGMFGMIIAVPIGIIVVSLYKEGLFRGLVDSIRIIWAGISNFRKFSPEEMAAIKGAQPKAEEEKTAKENE